MNTVYDFLKLELMTKIDGYFTHIQKFGTASSIIYELDELQNKITDEIKKLRSEYTPVLHRAILLENLISGFKPTLLYKYSDDKDLMADWLFKLQESFEFAVRNGDEQVLFILHAVF